jgi:hypothetical protein
MKTCIKCDIKKEIDEFSISDPRTQRRSTTCKACHREYAKIHYKNNVDKYHSSSSKARTKLQERNRQNLVEYLIGKCCVDCGITDIRVFHFDHDDPSTKYKNVCQLLKSHKWQTILDEIDKCSIRCANCHMIRTSIQFDWFKNRVSQ